jgi:hypothetical protein
MFSFAKFYDVVDKVGKINQNESLANLKVKKKT